VWLGLRSSWEHVRSFVAAPVAAGATRLDIWSFNLRTEAVDHIDGPNGWRYRREGVAELLGRHRPALVCTQEGTEPMLEFLARSIAKGAYKYVATARTPGRQDETAGILYDPERLDLLSHSATWLSPPGWEDGRPAWDAECPRTFEEALFRVRKSPGGAATRHCIRAVNTHLDHVGVHARSCSGKLLAQFLADAAKSSPECAQVVCGDFNSPKGGNEVYDVMTSALTGMSDVVRSVPVRGMVPSTIHKWQGTDFKASVGDGTVDLGAADGHGLAEDARHIDWMLWRNGTRGTALRPISCEVLQEKLGSGRWPSDHFPIATSFEAFQAG